LKPKVIGSAMMPWLRPTARVSRCSMALRSKAAVSRSSSSSRMAAESTSWVAESGVEDVGAGQPEMDPARLRAQRLAHGGDKCDDVVADLGLDLVDPLHHVCGALDLGDVLGRDHSQLAPGLGGEDLDAQPAIEFGGGCPDLAHAAVSVAGDHGVS